MSDALGLGIVGCGGAAADVCRAVAGVPELSVVALHDRDLALAEELARTTGGQACATLEELLAADAVQAVYIALPHDLLAPVAMQVVASGRHVLVEKPMALSLADADALGELAAARGLTVGVFFEMRFAPVAEAAARLVQSGAIGEVRAIRIRTLIDKSPDYWTLGSSGRSLSPWRGQSARAGGGVVLMNTSHQLDMVSAITGLGVTRVMGSIGTTTPGIDVEDGAAAVLTYGDGVIGSIVAGAHVPGAADGETIEIDGALGHLELEAYAGVLRVFLRRPFEGLPSARWMEPEVGNEDAFVGALAAFAAAARDGTRAIVGVPEARQVLATILGLYRSSAEGRVVDL